MKNKLALLLTAMMLFLALSAPLTAAAAGTGGASAPDPAASEPAEPGTPENEDSPAAYLNGDGTIKIEFDPADQDGNH